MKKVFFVFLLTLLCSSPAAGDVSEVPVNDTKNKEVPLYHESHALLIGVSQYSRGWPNLPGVVHDIDRVGKALQQHGFNVVTIIDPTRREMEDGFDNFINQYGHHPDNRLLFYYAGHGHTLKLAYGGDMGYIVPGDTPLPAQDKTAFLKVAMDMQLVEVFAKRIQAKHALFMFDSCFSGSIFSLSRSVPENISVKANLPVRQFITAGGPNEKVPDESIFSSQFIEALNGAADFDKDGFLTGTELGEFLNKQVANYSKGGQHPQYGKIRDPHLDKGDFIFQHDVTGAPLVSASLSTDRATNPASGPITAPRSTQLSREEVLALLQDLPSARDEKQLKKERKRLFEKNLQRFGKLNNRSLLASGGANSDPVVCKKQCAGEHQVLSRETAGQCRSASGTFKLHHENRQARFSECMNFKLSQKTRSQLRMCLALCSSNISPR